MALPSTVQASLIYDFTAGSAADPPVLATLTLTTLPSNQFGTPVTNIESLTFYGSWSDCIRRHAATYAGTFTDPFDNRDLLDDGNGQLIGDGNLKRYRGSVLTAGAIVDELLFRGTPNARVQFNGARINGEWNAVAIPEPASLALLGSATSPSWLGVAPDP